MMEMKLVCTKCGTINDNDAKYCKECGVSKEVKITEGLTKLAELAKVKTWNCFSCGKEMSTGPGLCPVCRSSVTSVRDAIRLDKDYNPWKTVEVRYQSEDTTKNIQG